MFIRIAAPFLFWAPYIHHQALQEVWGDWVRWEEALTHLKEEWQEFVLLVRVFLLL